MLIESVNIAVTRIGGPQRTAVMIPDAYTVISSAMVRGTPSNGSALNIQYPQTNAEKTPRQMATTRSDEESTAVNRWGISPHWRHGPFAAVRTPPHIGQMRRVDGLFDSANG